MSFELQKKHAGFIPRKVKEGKQTLGHKFWCDGQHALRSHARTTLQLIIWVKLKMGNIKRFRRFSGLTGNTYNGYVISIISKFLSLLKADEVIITLSPFS